MQLSRVLIAATGFAVASVAPTLGACLVAVPTPGIVALSSDGRALSSDNGVASVVTISNINLFGSTITIGAPRQTGGPVVPGSVVEESYTATWLLGIGQSTSGGYVSSIKTFNVPAVANLVVTIVLSNRITSNGGFPQSTGYTTATGIDCL